MAELRVDSFSGAAECARGFVGASEGLAELIASMERINQNLGGMWDGAAYNNFVAVYNEYRPILERMKAPIAELATIGQAKLDALASVQ